MSARAWTRRQTKAVRTWFVNQATHGEVWVQSKNGRMTKISSEPRSMGPLMMSYSRVPPWPPP